jgi:hypothetical protein
MLETIIGALGVVVSIATFAFGVRLGKRQEEERREHELVLERERREHELEMERDRQRRELVSKVADEYVDMARGRLDAGPHALATLGLEQLGSDAAIREAIEEMHVRVGEDPWSGQSKQVEDIDLAVFFRMVREERVDFFRTTVESVASRVRDAGHPRPLQMSRGNLKKRE